MTITPTGLRTVERRIFVTEFRAVKGSDRQKWATAVTYDTVDDYGTIWHPGVFRSALDQRMPTLLYGHDWNSLEHVLGKGIDHRDTPADVGPPGQDVLVEFDDPEFVPLARQAMYQVGNGTLKDVSVGFARKAWLDGSKLEERDRERGAKERMMEAGMDELSIVISGAVEGAHMRGTRSIRVAGGQSVDEQFVMDLARKIAAGEITQAEAKAAVELVSVGTPLGESSESGSAPAPEVDMAMIDAVIDQTLAGVDS